MAKPMPGKTPDPMSKVVDRLLAQLPGLDGVKEPVPTGSVRYGTQVGIGRELHQSGTAGDLLGLWFRVFLGFALGGMMLSWPYAHECGLPLSGYLLAVIAVMLAGGWAAVSAWKFRAPLAHVLSLILFFWGIVLGAEQLLPRIGYSIDRATWECPVSPSS
jgi:hypothetical protein